MVNMHNIVVSARTSFLVALKLCTADKDEMFYGDDKVSDYLIQISDRRVCDTVVRWYGRMSAVSAEGGLTKGE